MKDHYDVIIVGAGPAGTITAQYAAKNGASVLVLEKDRDVGMPVRCGEAVSDRSLEELVDIEPRWIASSIKRFKLIAPSGDVVEPILDGSGYVLERRIFDYDLARIAADFGAEVITKAYVDRLLFTNGKCDGVRFKDNNESQEVHAKIIVGADGVESRVGKWAGIDTTTHFRDMECCAQMTLSNIDIEDGVCEFYFGQEYAPQGYLWIFPKGYRIANVGVGISGEAGKKKSPIRYLKEFVEEKFPNAGILTTVAGGVPCAPTLEHIVRNNVVLVGDAAHQVNPISGGGITSGMIAGKIAGEVIARALRKNDLSILTEYENEWEKKVGAKHRTYYKMKNVVHRFSDESLNNIATQVLKIPVEKRTLWAIFRTALFKQPSLIWEMIKVFGLKM